MVIMRLFLLFKHLMAFAVSSTPHQSIFPSSSQEFISSLLLPVYRTEYTFSIFSTELLVHWDGILDKSYLWILLYLVTQF